MRPLFKSLAIAATLVASQAVAQERASAQPEIAAQTQPQGTVGAAPGAGGGRMLTINGVAMPRDLVFRFIPVTLPLAEIRVTSLYGMRKHPILGFNRLHTGVDFGAARGTPVHATAAGVVSFAGQKGALGNAVEVQHGLGFASVYGHLDSIDVRAGDAVDRGAVLGRAGSTGRSTGPHLHYEIRAQGKPLDPVDFLITAYELYRHLD